MLMIGKGFDNLYSLRPLFQLLIDICQFCATLRTFLGFSQDSAPAFAAETQLTAASSTENGLSGYWNVAMGAMALPISLRLYCLFLG